MINDTYNTVDCNWDPVFEVAMNLIILFKSQIIELFKGVIHYPLML